MFAVSDSFSKVDVRVLRSKSYPHRMGQSRPIPSTAVQLPPRRGIKIAHTIGRQQPKAPGILIHKRDTTASLNYRDRR